MADKEVYFWRYCPKCTHYEEEKPEDSETCDLCLTFGWNTDSHKPINFVEDDKKKETK